MYVLQMTNFFILPPSNIGNEKGGYSMLFFNWRKYTTVSTCALNKYQRMKCKNMVGSGCQHLSSTSWSFPFNLWKCNVSIASDDRQVSTMCCSHQSSRKLNWTRNPNIIRKSAPTWSLLSHPLRIAFKLCRERETKAKMRVWHFH